MKERTRRTDAYANRESDEVVVPEKSLNKGVPAPAEAVEERTSAKRNAGEDAVVRSQNRKATSYGLEGVRQRAAKDKEAIFTKQLLRSRVGDPWILRLIRKWLKTGYSEDRYLPRLRICQPLPEVRFDARTRGRSRMR